MPSRGDAAWQAVTSTIVSPWRTMTAPSACLASLPVSIERRLAAAERDALCVNVALADTQSLDQLGVAIGVVRSQVVEQAAALPDELEQPAARVVILGVRLEVIREVGDAVAQDGDLHFRGAGIAAVRAVRLDQCGLAFFRQWQTTILHARPSVSQGSARYGQGPPRPRPPSMAPQPALSSLTPTDNSSRERRTDAKGRRARRPAPAAARPRRRA